MENRHLFLNKHNVVLTNLGFKRSGTESYLFFETQENGIQMITERKVIELLEMLITLEKFIQDHIF